MYDGKGHPPWHRTPVWNTKGKRGRGKEEEKKEQRGSSRYERKDPGHLRASGEKWEDVGMMAYCRGSNFSYSQLSSYFNLHVLAMAYSLETLSMLESTYESTMFTFDIKDIDS
ncbi:hypothetical protein EYF80_017505 [Liparis tanakae]|uniref:Uncharacterized protein n=1 Tax=Liparis tanakae TaxID=230148 RepID=A0A4Z2I371_9TELE|nr:hypothetical protein EYF80_017505 [Liparis tanakae]